MSSSYFGGLQNPRRKITKKKKASKTTLSYTSKKKSDYNVSDMVKCSIPKSHSDSGGEYTGTILKVIFSRVVSEKHSFDIYWYLIWIEDTGQIYLISEKRISKLVMNAHDGFWTYSIFYRKLGVGTKVIFCTDISLTNCPDLSLPHPNMIKVFDLKNSQKQFIGYVTKVLKNNYYQVRYTNSKKVEKIPRHQLKIFHRLSDTQIKRYSKIKNIEKDLKKLDKYSLTYTKCRETQWEEDDKCYMDPIMPDCITFKNGFMTPSKYCYTEKTLKKLFENKTYIKDPFTRVRINYGQIKKISKKSLTPPKNMALFKKISKRRLNKKRSVTKKVKKIKKNTVKADKNKKIQISIGNLIKLFEAKTKNQLPKKTSRKISYRKALKVMRTLDKNIVIDNGKYFLQFKGVGKYFSDLVDKELKKKRATKKKGKTKSKKSKKKVTIKEKRERCKNRGLVYDSTTKRCRKSKRKRKRK